MRLRFLETVALLALAGLSASPAEAGDVAHERELRVCADPAALPLSNDREQGLENKLAALLAKKMDAHVTYTWWAERRGFVRNTLKAGVCDVVLGVPRDAEMMRTTRPYYRSGFAVLARKDRGLGDLDSFDDARLRSLRIGVPLVGEDYGNPPPVFALARRGIIDNVRGFAIAADRHRAAPTYVDELESGQLDVVIAWGPVAGILANQSANQSGGVLEAHLLAQSVDAGIPLTFEISLGVRKKDEALATKLDAVLVRNAVEIDALLDQFGVLRSKQ